MSDDLRDGTRACQDPSCATGGHYECHDMPRAVGPRIRPRGEGDDTRNVCTDATCLQDGHRDCDARYVLMDFAEVGITRGGDE